MDRQKKFLLFGAAWVSALLLTWFYYHNAVAPQQEKTLRMVVAARNGVWLAASVVPMTVKSEPEQAFTAPASTKAR